MMVNIKFKFFYICNLEAEIDAVLATAQAVREATHQIDSDKISRSNATMTSLSTDNVILNLFY